VRRSYQIEIASTPEQVFDLLHDYDRRLQWDSFLRRADIIDGSPVAGSGVRTLCVAKRRLGGLGMETEYVSFVRPTVAAVKMTGGPWFFRRFAATIRQERLGPNLTRVTYHFNVEYRAPVQYAFGQVITAILGRETRGRLKALKAFLERT